jgi:uncharacterized membrane protein SpoIIM required for sporulation
VTDLANPRAFRAAREAEWQQLDDIVTRAETGSVRALRDDELVALPVLYRGALSSLSVARETSLDLELITYLEGLCARAYFFVYGVRTSAWRRLGAFFARDWPRAVRSLWRYTLVALALDALGILVGYLLVGQDNAWFDSLFAYPEDGRNFNATADFLRDVLYSYSAKDGALSILATFLFTHNAQVGMLSFALGFAFGMPTAMLIIYNGATLGALFALYASHGLEAELGGWIFIHGTTEVLALALAGAAGFRIGWSVVFPGERSRLAAASEAGRTAAIVMAGVVVMLFVAGLLEGFGRQLITSDAARYAIGSVMLLAWCLYFYWPRGRAHG